MAFKDDFDLLNLLTEGLNTYQNKNELFVLSTAIILSFRPCFNEITLMPPFQKTNVHENVTKCMLLIFIFNFPFMH